MGNDIMGLPDTLDELEKFMQELEKLFVVSLDYPRSDDDFFWDEEVEKLKILREKESELLKQLKDMEGSDDDASLSKYIAQEDLLNSPLGQDSRFDLYDKEEEQRIRQLGTLSRKIVALREAMQEILYNKPGVIPETIYRSKETIERFNKIEQPRIEKILDDIDLTLQESHKVISNANKSIENTQGILAGFSKYETPLMIGMGALGLLLIAIMVMVLLVLVKIAFF
ncbi:MAG: hypothetical protein LUQ70_01815 [Methanobacteriaceae archaeon]|nr:hypothetical protein [Methanobacteriaceae archaeon]